MKYKLKIGDEEQIGYGWDPKSAWASMIEFAPHLIYCSEPGDLERVPRPGLEDYLHHYKTEFYFDGRKL